MDVALTFSVTKVFPHCTGFIRVYSGGPLSPLFPIVRAEVRGEEEKASCVAIICL